MIPEKMWKIRETSEAHNKHKKRCSDCFRRLGIKDGMSEECCSRSDWTPLVAAASCLRQLACSTPNDRKVALATYGSHSTPWVAELCEHDLSIGGSFLPLDGPDVYVTISTSSFYLIKITTSLSDEVKPSDSCRVLNSNKNLRRSSWSHFHVDIFSWENMSSTLTTWKNMSPSGRHMCHHAWWFSTQILTAGQRAHDRRLVVFSGYVPQEMATPSDWRWS